jgi:hypothetical protein
MLSTGESSLLNLLGLLPFIICFQNIWLQSVSAEITRGQVCLWEGIASLQPRPKPDVVVSIARIHPVAIRRPQVVGVVDQRAAAHNAFDGTSKQTPLTNII